jgi:hypothetical protein
LHMTDLKKNLVKNEIILHYFFQQKSIQKLEKCAKLP